MPTDRRDDSNSGLLLVNEFGIREHVHDGKDDISYTASQSLLKVSNTSDVATHGIRVANASITIALSSMSSLLPYSPTTGDSIMINSVKMSPVVSAWIHGTWIVSVYRKETFQRLCKREQVQGLTKLTQCFTPGLGMILSTEQPTGIEITPRRPHIATNATVTLATYVTLGIRPNTADRRTSIEDLDRASAM